jgi:hypothetical protein
MRRSMQVTLKLYATLADYLPPGVRSSNAIELDVPTSTTIDALTGPFNLPSKLAAIGRRIS